MLSPNELETLKKTIENSARPLIFFDDDADGLASYLLIKTVNTEARGLRAARGPELTHHFIGFAKNHSPDNIFIIDKPLVSEQFIQTIRTPTTWLDHHDPSAYEPHKQHTHLTYLNPAKNNPENHQPTSFWAYKAIHGPLWLATAGVTSDWDTTLLEDFRKEYPELAPQTNDIIDALYNSKLGEIIKILNFCLKGSTQEINTCIQALEQIHTPQELLENTSTASKTIHKHVQPIMREYKQQLQLAQQGQTHNGVYSYLFSNLETSLVTNVANEMLTKTQADIIAIGREEQGKINFSLRSTHVHLPELLEQALRNIQGYGGGHEHACGGSIDARDWSRFLEALKQAHNTKI